MPEIARLFGIIIRMYMEPITPHNRPHFHAYYQDLVAVIAVDKVELIAGHLPTRQLQLTCVWAERHRDALLRVWELLQNGQPPFKIEPLT